MNWLHAFYPGDSVILSIGVFLAQMTLLLVVGLIAGRWFRWEAATRHHILLVTWLSVLAIPLLSWGLSVSNMSTAFQEKLRLGFTAITHHAERAATDAAHPAFLAPNATSELPRSIEQSALPYETVFSLLGLAWISGVLVTVVRLANSARELARIQRSSTPLEANHPLAEACRCAAKNAGTARTPGIRVSTECNSPVVIGLLRPTLLFPQRLLGTLSDDALRHVLEHEMAHVARRDYLVVWLQHAFAALFWFHPLVHLFNRQLAQVREELCDNHVLKSTQETEYGYTLLSVAEAIDGIAPPQPAVGLLTVNWSLESRIAQILHHRRKTMTRVSLQHACTTSLVALAMTSALALCHPAMAGDADEAKVGREAVTIHLEGIDLQQLQQEEMPARRLLMIVQDLLEAERKAATKSIERKPVKVEMEVIDPLATEGKPVRIRIEETDPFATKSTEGKPVKFHIQDGIDQLETKAIEKKAVTIHKQEIDLHRKELRQRLQELQQMQKKIEQKLLTVEAQLQEAE